MEFWFVAVDALPAVLSVAKRPSHFLLRAQEKVTKEKGTPEGALGGRPARPPFTAPKGPRKSRRASMRDLTGACAGVAGFA